MPLLWLGPDLIGVGGAFGASSAALGDPSAGQRPARAGARRSRCWATRPSCSRIPAAAAGGVRRGDPAGRTRACSAAGALAWVLLVAVMTQAGYAGNPRYLVAAAAVGCVLAGVGVACWWRRL